MRYIKSVNRSYVDNLGVGTSQYRGDSIEILIDFNTNTMNRYRKKKLITLFIS